MKKKTAIKRIKQYLVEKHISFDEEAVDVIMFHLPSTNEVDCSENDDIRIAHPTHYDYL